MSDREVITYIPPINKHINILVINYCKDTFDMTINNIRNKLMLIDILVLTNWQESESISSSYIINQIYLYLGMNVHTISKLNGYFDSLGKAIFYRNPTIHIKNVYTELYTLYGDISNISFHIGEDEKVYNKNWRHL